MSVPTMAWTVLLFGLLAYGSGQRKGLCILGGTKIQSPTVTVISHNNTCVSPVCSRCGFSDCGDAGAITVSVCRRDSHTHLWP